MSCSSRRFPNIKLIKYKVIFLIFKLFNDFIRNQFNYFHLAFERRKAKKSIERLKRWGHYTSNILFSIKLSSQLQFVCVWVSRIYYLFALVSYLVSHSNPGANNTIPLTLTAPSSFSYAASNILFFACKFQTLQKIWNYVELSSCQHGAFHRKLQGKCSKDENVWFSTKLSSSNVLQCHISKCPNWDFPVKRTLKYVLLETSTGEQFANQKPFPFYMAPSEKPKEITVCKFTVYNHF